MADERTLLLIDVVDSTLLAEQLGDAAIAELWVRHDRVARDLLPLHRGREIDKTDGFLLLFDAAADAAAYALAYHEAIADLAVSARAGLHVGPVVVRENSAVDVARGAKPVEVDGLAKPTAARVMSLALGGQTLLTAEAAEVLGPTYRRVQSGPDGRVPDATDPVLLSHGHWMLKGRLAPVEIFELGIPGKTPMAPPPDAPKAWRVVWRNDAWVPIQQVEHSLPRERDEFVGREKDLHDLAAMLDEGAALVSVLGIGGTGKTRLVTHYGWTWLGAWPGGVWFCDLSEARGRDGIVFAVARALDVPLGSGEPVAQLGHAIAGRGRCLVLLDNFEQVTRHAPDTLGHWLDVASEAQFVVTTREVLGLPGERALALPPLREVEAVELFLARASQARCDFALAAGDSKAVEELVRLLDCLPLAIELAAARVRIMPPAVLLSRMSQRFKLLASSGGRRDRQATLRAALDWSWDLLSEPEQAALAQLSAFEGGFTLDAAEAVVDLSVYDDAPWPMDAVQALVDKSLVRRVTDDAEQGSRFGMLVSVQEYAAEKLASGLPAMPAPQLRQDSERRHVDWFEQLGSDDAVDTLHLSGWRERLRALTAETDNLTVAVRRALAAGDGESASRALTALWAILVLRGPFLPAVELAAHVLDAPGIPAAAQARCLRVYAEALMFSGRLDDALPPIERALALARQIGDRRQEGLALAVVGEVHWMGPELTDARPHLEAGLACAREIGNRRLESWLLNDLGVSSMGEDIPNASRHFEEAIEIGRRLDSPILQCMPLNNLANLLFDLGRFTEALDRWQAAAEIAAWIGDRKYEAICLGNMGHLHRHLGRLDEARPMLTRALSLHREVGFLYGQPYWLYNLALANVMEGRLDEALELCSEAIRIAEPFRLVVSEALTGLARVHLARGETGLARAALERARPYDGQGQVTALVDATVALVAAEEGDATGAAAAIARASIDETLCRPGTEVGVLVAMARGRLADVDATWVGASPAEA